MPTLTPRQSHRVQRTALIATGIDALGTGSYISTATVLFTQHLGVSPAAVGIGLALSGVTGMLASLPISSLADQWGSLKVFACAYVVRAVGTLVWCGVSGDLQYVLYSSVFGMVDRSAASLTRSLMVAPLRKEESIRLLGLAALPSNVGYGVGAGFGTLVLVYHWPLVVILAVNALTFVLVVFLYWRTLSGFDTSKARVNRSAMTSWSRMRQSLDSRHRRGIVWENFLFSFHRTLLNVYIPLDVVVFLPRYLWLVPLLFVVNAVVVAATQASVNSWVDQRGRHHAVWGASGILLGISMLFLPLLALPHQGTTGVLLACLSLLQVVTELGHSAALTVHMVRMSRAANLTTDLSTLNLGGQLQNILGPSLFSVLMIPGRWPIALVAGSVIGAQGVHALRRIRRTGIH